jgi:hypothetical protein
MVSCRISPEAGGKSMLPNSNVCLYTAQAISGVASVFLVCFRIRICQKLSKHMGSTCGQSHGLRACKFPSGYPLVN